jgi:primary-amine oxidase
MPNFRSFISFCLLLFFASPAAAQSDLAHPLDPLSKEEIAVVVAALKAENKATDSSRFFTLVLREIPKAEVLAFKPGASFRREAFIVVFERAANRTFEAVVDVNARKVVSWKEIKNVQPSMVPEDFALAQRPIMPVHKTGFKLIPNGFFARNPAMDIPRD